MSVERYEHSKYLDPPNGYVDGKMIRNENGSFVLFTDYERDCIKGRCGGCKKLTKNMYHAGKQYCELNKRWVYREGYCDEWEAK
jgi:hypothetical protein